MADVDTSKQDALLSKSLDEIIAERGDSGRRKSGAQRRSSGAHERAEKSSPYTKSAGGAAASGPRVYVGNLAFDVDWKALKALFVRSGFNNARADVAQKEDGRSKGWGTVTFSSAEEASRAISQLDGAELNGRRMFLKHDHKEGVPVPSASPKATQQQGQGRPIQVRNAITVEKHAAPAVNPDVMAHINGLPFDINADELKRIFAECGRIVDARIGEKFGKSMGWATITFTSPAAVAKAIAEFDGAKVNDRLIKVSNFRPKPVE